MEFIILMDDTMMQIIRKIVAFIGTVTLTGCISFSVKESTFIFPFKTTGVQLDVLITSEFSPKLKAFTTTSSHGSTYINEIQLYNSKCIILYLGGNLFTIDTEADEVLKDLLPLGCDIVFQDYFGYGRSTGETNVSNLITQARDTLSFVATRNKKIILHGHSLGGILATQIINENIDGIVLEATSDSVYNWAKYMIPWYVRPLITVKIDARLDVLDENAVTKIKQPVIVFAGGKDESVPLAASNELFNKLGSSEKYLFVLNEADHNSIKKQDDYLVHYKAFLNAL